MIKSTTHNLKQPYSFTFINIKESPHWALNKNKCASASWLTAVITWLHKWQLLKCLGGSREICHVKMGSQAQKKDNSCNPIHKRIQTLRCFFFWIMDCLGVFLFFISILFLNWITSATKLFSAWNSKKKKRILSLY